MTPDQLALAVQSILDTVWTPIPGSSWSWAAVVALAFLGGGAAFGVRWGIPHVRAWWSDSTIRPGEDERGVSTVEMTLIEHLIELKNRFVVIGIVVAVTTIGAFVFYQQWMRIALWPLGGHELQAITPTEKVMAYFKVSFVVAIATSMPVIMLQIWRYIAPGLTRTERRWIVAFVPGATVSFIAGLAFAYFALMPAALTFLLGFGDDAIKVVPTIASYIDFVTRLMLAAGAIFQMPLIMFILVKVGVVTVKKLSFMRRYVVVFAFLVGAVVTPTPDPFNQLLVAVPVMLLFEFGALLARFA